MSSQTSFKGPLSPPPPPSTFPSHESSPTPVVLHWKDGERIEETPSLVEDALRQLHEQLDGIEPELQAAWKKAQEQCPTLVDTRHKLMFLRCELYDAELAALRLVNYWNKRVEYFGPEDAFAPLSLERSMKNDMTALSMGNIVWTGQYDGRGRGIFVEDLNKFDIYFDRPSHAYLRERSMVRVWWYLIHAALQEDRVQCNGAIHIMLGGPFGPRRNFTFKLSHVLLDLMAFALPIRFHQNHLCRPGLWLRFVGLAIFRRMVAKRQRLEIPSIVHLGSPEKVCRELTSDYQIPKEAIPRALGGGLSWDHAAWIRQRREAGL